MLTVHGYFKLVRRLFFLRKKFCWVIKRSNCHTRVEDSNCQLNPGESRQPNSWGLIPFWFLSDNHRLTQIHHLELPVCTKLGKLLQTLALYLIATKWCPGLATLVFTNTKWKRIYVDCLVYVPWFGIHFIHWILTTTLPRRHFWPFVLHQRSWDPKRLKETCPRVPAKKGLSQVQEGAHQRTRGKTGDISSWQLLHRSSCHENRVLCINSYSASFSN